MKESMFQILEKYKNFELFINREDLEDLDENELVVVLEAWELTTENTIVKIIIDETLEKVLNLTVVETEGE